MLVVSGSLWWTSRTDGRLHLIFPAQPGDGILVRGPRGEIAVVDGGADGAAFVSWLGGKLPLGRRRIDLLVLTRADKTTLPGQLATVRRYAVNQAVLVRPPKETPQWAELVRALSEHGTPIHMAAAGDQFVLGTLSDPLHTRMVVLATDEGRLLLELRAMNRRILLFHSIGKRAFPHVRDGPVATLVVPWRQRMDDPVLQRIAPEAIIFGEQPGNDPAMTLSERRIGSARLLHERIDGEIEIQIDVSGTRIATRRH
jgi:hypothetical protein